MLISKKNKYIFGYTINEIMLVLSIISIILVLATISYRQYINKSRDLETKNFATNLQKQIELDVHNNLYWPDNKIFNLSEKQRKYLSSAKYVRGNFNILHFVPTLSSDANVKGYIELINNDGSTSYAVALEENQNIVWLYYAGASSNPNDSSTSGGSTSSSTSSGTTSNNSSSGSTSGSTSSGSTSGSSSSGSTSGSTSSGSTSGSLSSGLTSGSTSSGSTSGSSSSGSTSGSTSSGSTSGSLSSGSTSGSLSSGSTSGSLSSGSTSSSTSSGSTSGSLSSGSTSSSTSSGSSTGSSSSSTSGGSTGGSIQDPNNCGTGSYWNGSACVNCTNLTGPTGAIQPCSSNADTSCTNGTTISGNTCICPNNQYWNGTLCTTCTTNTIASCNQNGAPTTCNQGYFLSGAAGVTGTTCTACPNTCQTCTSNTNCTACINGYILNNNQCLPPCPDNCKSSCSNYLWPADNINSTYCDFCSKTYPNCRCISAAVSSCNSSGNPTSCTQGAFLNGSAGTNGTICTVCPSSCKACTSNTNCTICNSGYVLNNNQCIPSCPQQCKDICTNPNPYYLDTISQFCDSCKNNYIDCPKTCPQECKDMCTNPSYLSKFPQFCDFCQNYYIGCPKITAPQCPVGQYMLNSVCTPCEIARTGANLAANSMVWNGSSCVSLIDSITCYQKNGNLCQMYILNCSAGFTSMVSGACGRLFYNYNSAGCAANAPSGLASKCQVP